MKKTSSILYLFLSGLFFLFPIAVFAQCADHDLWGFAWSENIGWISFSCQSETAITTHWELVDDPVGAPDNDATYVWTDSAIVQKDAYEIENPIIPPGDPQINSIRVWNVSKGGIEVFFRLNGIEHDFNPGGSSCSNVWALENRLRGDAYRPGGGSWTWDDITNLQIAFGLRTCLGSVGGLTQFYVEVIYDGGSIILMPNGDGDYMNIENPPVLTVVNYGVDIDEENERLTGYAWSENIGWISFNVSDLADCPSGTCEANMDISGKTGNLSGWARALAPVGRPLSETGGWDGWISLSNTNYQVTLNVVPEPSEFENWAWGSEVLGWISFNSSNIGATVPYAVKTNFSFAPTAINLNNTQGNYCFAASPPIFLNWTFSDFDPGDTQSAYYVQMDDNSDFSSPDVDTGKVSSSSNSFAPINPSFNATYYWRVMVWDSSDVASSWINGPSFITDPRWPEPNFTWDPASPLAEEDVQFTDSTTNCTSCSYEWNFGDGSPFNNLQNPIHIFPAENIYSVNLRAISGTRWCDNANPITVGAALPLPIWNEIAPF